MTLVGYVCPPGHVDPPEGTRHRVDYCLAECPSPCIAPPLLHAMHTAEVANPHQGAYISASMLAGQGCLREVYYERTPGIELYEHPTRRYWAFRGTHAHSIIERGADQLRPLGWLQEMKMRVDLTYPDLPQPLFDGKNAFTGDFDRTAPLVIQVGGTLDAYNWRRRELWDMKSMADAKAEAVIKGSKPDATFSANLEDRWVWQTNIYRWLLCQTPIPPEIKEEFPELAGYDYYPEPTMLAIQGIAMMSIPRTGSTYVFRKGRTTSVHAIDSVPVLPLGDVEAFVRREALRWYRGLVLRQLPPVVDAQHKWLCRNCLFNGEIVAGGPCHPEAERARLA